MKVRPSFLPEIEVLRGLAILCTFFQHFVFGYMPLEISQNWADFLNSFSLSFGVDIFFCISGFVIMRNLLQSYELTNRKTFWSQVWRFWSRRMWRLYPSVWFAVALGIILSLLFFHTGTGYFGDFDRVVRDGTAAVLQYFNFYGSRCTDRTACGPNTVFWTLSLEEQFYFLLPFVLFLSGRHYVKTLSLLLVVQLLLPRPVGSILNDVRSDGFILGALLAVAHQNSHLQRLEPNFLANGWARLLSMSLLLLGDAVAERFALTDSTFYGRSIVTLISAIFVFLASFDQGYVMKEGRCRAVWMYLGSRSYVIYLLHMLAFGLALESWYALWKSGHFIPLSFHLDSTLLVSSVVLTLVMAELLHKAIEQPFIAHYKATALK